ncbi:putative membrane protein [Cocos nucifera]|uniref:Putative membrane protein n=1 Tax=Cocos nucifera TaxID=13894 RepID=A0A8K0N4V3_COCNU|nr:putative membrane protein [Cocos nucifera]
MNDLSATAAGRRCQLPVPAAVPCVIVPLLFAALAVSLLILVVVHNAILLAAVLLLSALIASFLLWNAASFRNDRAVLVFLDRLPTSDLVTARDGQLVKITGRFAADFCITDIKSGTRALVKAGYSSKVFPLIDENILVNTTSKNRELSSTLKNWLERRHLSAEARLLRLKEGYIKEGSSLTVMGMLSRKNGALMIVPPPEPFSTGCLLQEFLLPADIDGLVLKFSGKNSSMTNQSVS